MKDYMRQVEDKIATLEAKRIKLEGIRTQIAMLEAEACSVGAVSYNRSPIRGGGNHQEQKLCAYVDEKIKLEKRERATAAEIEQIERAIKCLTDQERRVLDVMCRQETNKGEAVRKLERELHLSQASVYRLRERALWQLACRLGYD